jgi:hypothetical protein
MFVHSEQASPIFKGAVEIRINSHLVREITWQHDTCEPHRYHEWPPFSLTIKESGRVLSHPSVVFHTKTSMGNPWAARTLSQCTPVKQGKISSNSMTVKLLSLREPINPVCVSTQLSACCNRAQSTRSSTDTGGGYHLGAPNLTSDHSQPSYPVFPIFPLVALPGLT